MQNGDMALGPPAVIHFLLEEYYFLLMRLVFLSLNSQLTVMCMPVAIYTLLNDPPPLPPPLPLPLLLPIPIPLPLSDTSKEPAAWFEASPHHVAVPNTTTFSLPLGVLWLLQVSLISQDAELQAGLPPKLLRFLSTLPQGKILDPFRFTTFYIYFALVLCAFILSCFQEKPPLFSPENLDTVSLPQEGRGDNSLCLTQIRDCRLHSL